MLDTSENLSTYSDVEIQMQPSVVLMNHFWKKTELSIFQKLKVITVGFLPPSFVLPFCLKMKRIHFHSFSTPAHLLLNKHHHVLSVIKKEMQALHSGSLQQKITPPKRCNGGQCLLSPPLSSPSFPFFVCSVVTDSISLAQAKEEHFTKFLTFSPGEIVV